MSKKQPKNVLFPIDLTQSFDLFGFRLSSKGLVPLGSPTLDDFNSTFDFVLRVHKFSGFWLVDLIKYADSRPEWSHIIDQILDAQVLTEKSLKQYRYLGRNMLPTEERVEGAGFGLHKKVAALPPEEQKQWVERARDEGWSQEELGEQVKAAERVKVIRGQAKLAGMFRVIYADPPWQYSDAGVPVTRQLGKASMHYPTMSIEQLCALPVKAHALPDSILFMWVTSPLLLQNPGPREVLEAWGFEYKSSFVWDKVRGMRGHYNHVVHEHLVIATRGSCLPDVPVPQPKSVQTIRRDDTHSTKPDEFRRLIQTHWTEGPYLELFARKPAEGWSVFGNDARLWTGTNGKPAIDIHPDDVPF